jgi:hypothetical protein
LPPIPPHFVSFVWRYLGCTRCVRSSTDECAAEAWSWSPGSPAGKLPRRRQDLPSSWETQISVCTCSATPAGLLAPDHYGVAAWPLVCEKQRLPRGVFRRSIAWLSDSLSTHHRVRYLTTAQDSLPVVGQTLLDGLLTRRVSTKGFRVVVTSHSPFPSLLAQSHRPTKASALMTSSVSCGGVHDRMEFCVGRCCQC